MAGFLFHNLLIELTLLFGAAPSPPAVYPVFAKDARLAALVTVEKSPITIGAALHEVHRQAGVDLIAEAELLRRPVMVEVRNRSARDVLTEIGLVTGGAWVKRGEAYLLMADSSGAALTGRTPAGPAVARCQQLLANSLSRVQWRRLQSDQPLSFQELSPDQQRQFMITLGNEFSLHPDRHPRSMLTGQQAELRYIHGEPPQLALCAPVQAPDGTIISPPFALLPLDAPRR